MNENINVTGIDFSATEAATAYDDSPLPRGNYLFQIVKFHTTNKNGEKRVSPSGIQDMAVELKVVEPAKYINRRTFPTFKIFNGSEAMVNFQRAMFGQMHEAAGVINKAEWGVPISVYGRKVMGQLDHREFDGRTYEEIKSWYPEGSRPAEVVEGSGTQRNPNNAPAARPAPTRNAPPRAAPAAPARHPAQQATQQSYQQPTSLPDVATQQPHVNIDPFATEDFDDDVPF